MKTSRDVKHAHIVCWVCLAKVSGLRCPARLKCSLLPQSIMNSVAMSQIPDMMNVHSRSSKCIMHLQNIKDERWRPCDIKNKDLLLFISSNNLALKKLNIIYLMGKQQRYRWHFTMFCILFCTFVISPSLYISVLSFNVVPFPSIFKNIHVCKNGLFT